MNVNSKVYMCLFLLCFRLVQCDLRAPRLIIAVLIFFLRYKLWLNSERRSTLNFGLMSVNHWRVLLCFFFHSVLFLSSTGLCGTELDFCKKITMTASVGTAVIAELQYSFSDFLGLHWQVLSVKEILFLLGLHPFGFRVSPKMAPVWTFLNISCSCS